MKKRYVADLTRQMAECEANYRRLLQLLPDWAHSDSWEYGVSSQDADLGVMRLEVVERSRYTTLLRIRQEGPWGCDWLRPPVMTVRLYHDARMAEVVGYQRQRHFEGHYTYPNPHMRQPDEKLQLNAFLGEWLTHCLQHGYVLEPVRIGGRAC